MDIKEIQSLRKVFLLKLYHATGGDIWQNPIMFEIGKQIGIEDSLTEIIADYLNQKGFIEINTKARDISITTKGIDEAEKYYENSTSYITPIDINKKLDEINMKLDLITHGQQILYEDIMSQFESSQSIQIKDFKLVLISTFFSKFVDAIKISQLLDLVK